MILSYDYNYGADIDGNRGITVVEAELDISDIDWVSEQIIENYEYDQRYYTVFASEDGYDFEFEVDMYDYLTDEEIISLESQASCCGSEITEQGLCSTCGEHCV